jgi:hypothetical protein
VACQLCFFCRSGEDRGDAALGRLLDHLLETGEPLFGEALGPFVDSVAAFRLATMGADGVAPVGALLTLEVRVGVAEIAQSVIAASPDGEQGIWGAICWLPSPFSGEAPDWPLVNRIWAAAATLWAAVPWDEASGFAIVSDAPQA